MTQHTKSKKKIALACKLTAPDQIKRMNELHQMLFAKVNKTIEYNRSYELIFQHPDDELSAELVEFILFERLCCPWLKFQLIYQPYEGPVSLRLGNSAETKAMAKVVIGLEM
jgi:hypothetical protein